MIKFIYVLFDSRYPIDYRYCGYSYDSKNRKEGHIIETNMGKKSHKCNWIRKVLHEGGNISCKTVDSCKEDDIYEREKFWIKSLRECGYKLTNQTDGGEGILGYHHTEEGKKRISSGNRGKKFTEEHRKNLANSLSKVLSVKWQDPEFSERTLKSFRASIALRNSLGIKVKRKPHKDSTKQKLRDCFIGKKKEPFTQQHKDKMKASAIASHNTLEYRQEASERAKEMWRKRKLNNAA